LGLVVYDSPDGARSLSGTDSSALVSQAARSTPTTVPVTRAWEIWPIESADRPTRVDGIPERVGPYRPLRMLGRGGMGIVYEAVHDATGLRVALKTAIRDSERSLARLRAEILALERVTHPGIVRLLDRGSDEGVHFYAMDLLEGSTWQEYTEAIWPVGAQRPGDKRPRAANGRLDEVIRRAVTLAEALGHLHGMGLVHCDVSPRNVFVRTNGTTVLMDLGLVSRHRGAVGPEVLDQTDVPTGTLGYMAPEQALGLSVDARADLYSLGAMIHAAVSGRPASHHGPRILSSLASDVPLEVDSLVERLLSPDRAQRPLTAADVAQALRGVLEDHRDAPPSAPTARLFRSRVFGRDEVLRSLWRAIDRADVSGSFSLIAGPSGIGKTAVAAMVARRAAMSGLRVVTGECVSLVPTGGRHRPGLRGPQLSPLGPLLEVAIDHALSHDKPALHEILRSIGRHDGRAAAAFPGEPQGSGPTVRQAVKRRLCDDIGALLAELARAGPVLLVLDDLHCADELTMHFLASLPVDYFEQNRIALVATYRTDRSDDLVRLLSARPYVSTIVLGALDLREVREMIAESSGFRAPEPWVRILHDKAAGNPFLVAEYLRAALDEGMLVSGQDPAMAAKAAQAFAILAGSIEQLIGRRLGALAPATRRVLQLAAVIGNPIPERLLAEVSETTEDALVGHLEGLIGQNLLEKADSAHHRFMHDRLREVAYDSADDGARRGMHRSVARAIEARAESDGARAAIAPVLAHHFIRGGEDKQKARTYLELAADVAHRAFANREVVALLTEALSVASDLPNADDARIAQVHFRLASAYFDLGMLEESRAHVERMLDRLDFRLPARGMKGWWRCLLEVGRQVAHRVFGAARVDPQSGLLLREAVRAHDLLMQVHFYKGDNVPGMLHCTLAGLNLAERLGPCAELRLAYANVQSTAAMLGLRRVANAYEALGRASTSPEDDLVLCTSAWVRQCVQHIIFGEWDRADVHVHRIIEEARAADYQRREEEGISILAYMRFAQARYDHCRELCSRLQRSARGDAQSLCWSLIFRSHTDLVSDRAEAAVASATEGLEVARELPGRSESINLHAALALGLLRLGDCDGAERHARAALDLGRASELIVFLEIVSYANLAEVTYRLVSRPVRGGSASARALEDDAFRRLGRCARLFPIAVPRAELWKGARHWRSGRGLRARAAWRRAARAARALQTPYEQARADLLLELCAATCGSRDEALARAQATFKNLGAAFDERTTSETRGSCPIDPCGSLLLG
jgi:serine/threonine protein kinase/tetratricopeptide (TPR) repeat protein